MKKLVITGMGAITPVGNSVKEYWESLIAGKSGIGMITKFDASEIPVKIAANAYCINGSSSRASLIRLCSMRSRQRKKL